MKRLPSILIVSLLLSLLGGCENAIEFNGHVTEPLFVLNSIVHEGERVRVRVSHSLFFLDSTAYDGLLTDAKVTVIINGVEASVPYDKDSHTYLDTRTVHEGDHILIIATHNKYGTCRGETVVPHQTPVTANYTVSPYGGWTNTVYTPDVISFARTDSVAHVTFSLDLPEGNNFYRLTVDPQIGFHLHDLGNYIGGGDWWPVFDGEYGDTASFARNAAYIIPTTTRMKLGINSLEGMLDDFEIELTDDERFVDGAYEILFTDEYLRNSGERSLLFHIMLSTPYWWYGKEYYYDPSLQPPQNEEEYVHGNPWDYLDTSMQCQVRLTLESLTPEYYHYITSSEAYENNEYDIFSEPVQIYSNIEGGIGIVAASSVNEVILTIPYRFDL